MTLYVSSIKLSVLHVQCDNVLCSNECSNVVVGFLFGLENSRNDGKKRFGREESGAGISRVFVRLVSQFQTPKIKKGKTWKT